MNSTAGIQNLLASTALFAETDASTRAKVAAALRPVAFEEGRTIFSRGDAGGELYLVVKGRVRLQIVSESGRELSFMHAMPGSLFGEIAALDGNPRTADAVAATAVEAMVLARPEVNRLLAAAPDFAASAVRFLCARLRATDELLISIGFHPIEVRIARLLLYAMKRQAHRAQMGEVAIDFPYSQSELAALIGASRPKVSLALSALEAQGIIARERDRMRFDVGRLAAVAQSDSE